MRCPCAEGVAAGADEERRVRPAIERAGPDIGGHRLANGRQHRHLANLAAFAGDAQPVTKGHIPPCQVERLGNAQTAAIEHHQQGKIETRIADFGDRARNGKITPDDMAGGSFTISNGGVYGSLMSTPILNPPQSGILGMHKIEKRAVVVDDAIVIRPMMYLALSYDHRIIDGREAVSFLARIKELVEDPRRIVLGV